MYLTQATITAGRVHLAGRVVGPTYKSGKVRIPLRTSCSSYRTVALVSVGANGIWTATVAGPGPGQVGTYRAQTEVLVGRHSAMTYTLPHPIPSS